MRWLFFIMVMGSVGAADAPRTGMFTLKIGDRMDITMHGYTQAQGFSFSHEDIAGKMHIKANALRQLSLKPVSTPAAARRHGALVYLFNGDELSGDIIKLTEQSLEFDTWYAGRLSIPRAQVQWLVPGTGGVVFDGPKSLNGWGAAIIGVLLGDDIDNGVEGITIQDVFADSPAAKGGLQIGDIITHINGKPYTKKELMIAFVKSQKIGDKLKVSLLRGDNVKVRADITLGSLHWEFDNGSFISKGTGYVIGKELKWPPMASVDFDLEWERDIALDVMLCTDRLHSVSYQNAYLLRLTGGPSYLYRNTSAGEGDLQTTSLGSGNPAWGSARKAHVSIRLDRRTATIALLINERLVRKWVDRAGFAGKGNVLQFNPRTDSRMAIHNLRISEWNGRLPKVGPSVGQSGAQDALQFHKGEQLTGQILTIVQGKLNLKSDFGPISIPLGKIANISFAKRKDQIPDPKPNGPQLKSFNLGRMGKVSVNLLEWSPKAVRVISPVLGELNLTPSIINSVQFR